MHDNFVCSWNRTLAAYVSSIEKARSGYGNCSVCNASSQLLHYSAAKCLKAVKTTVACKQSICRLCTALHTNTRCYSIVRALCQHFTITAEYLKAVVAHNDEV